MRDTVRNPLISKGPNRATPAQNGTIAPKLLVLRARRVFVVTLLYAALLSACINLLQLTMPLYMMQVHDRVLNSQSMDTLVMLTILALGALIVLGVLDYIRALTFQAMGSAVVRWLNLPVLTAAVQASADQGLARATQSLRDLTELRGFLTSSAVSAPPSTPPGRPSFWVFCSCCTPSSD